MPPRCILPPELLLMILSYSDTLDIIRWRTVSKWFCAVTHNYPLWKSLYTDYPLPHPPGPSSHQSRAYLERMLVKSAQLARSWTTRPMREVASVNIKLGRPLATTPIKLIAGRWLIGCEDARRFVLHDADPRAETPMQKKVLWEQEERAVSAWDAHSMSPVEGQSVVYVLLALSQTEEVSPKWKLLEFRLNDESGEIYDSVTIDSPAWARSSLSRVGLNGGLSRFLFIPTETPRGVVFDTQTHTFYRVPGYRAALEETIPADLRDLVPFHYLLEFTGTHIISLCYYIQDLFHDINTLIQIFAIPSDGSSDQNDTPCLHLTHEGFTGVNLYNTAVMEPCVDPITGDTSIKFIDYCPFDGDPEILIINLTLPKRFGSEVTRMTIDDHQRICISKGIKSNHYRAFRIYFDVCDGKQLRGFCRAKPIPQTLRPVENQHVMKFSIDMTQGPWTVEYGQLTSAQWRGAADQKFDMTGRGIMFDGLRGRLCYVHPRMKHQFVVVEIE